MKQGFGGLFGGFGWFFVIIIFVVVFIPFFGKGFFVLEDK